MVSGGGDSVALLYLLLEIEDLRARMHVLHVNHHLSGGEEDYAEEQVRRLCAELDLPLTVTSHDVADIARSERQNVEDAGRRLRYADADRVLDRLCTDAGCDRSDGRILTAHSRDDRVETFFVRAIMGSGTGALAGIRPQRGRIIRPLLDIDRIELRDWLTARNISWWDDPLNDDLEGTRVFIRTNIIPAAEQLRANFRENLARTMDLVADDEALLQRMARGFATDFLIESSCDVLLEMDALMLSTLERVMLRRVLREAIVVTFPHASRLESFHIEAIADAVSADAQQQWSRDISGGLRATLSCATLKVAPIQA
ncbi:MAG: tRNA lysidine(34) synthetase TilS [Actinomycetes bacterium]|jgi:tRNA(Ile)-lysidine synthase|nr:tRNA lysidine(34) synthetase TilS [Actinomycetes bacterium]